MSDTRQARIDAGARAIYERYERSFSDDILSWPLVCKRFPADADHYRDLSEVCLDAADAVAHAVEVSELNEAIEKVRHAARVAGATGYDWAISAERSACQDLFDLLTAQPENGGSDGEERPLGQPTRLQRISRRDARD